MNKIDLHVHTVASGHAFNTIHELAAAAEKMGMEAIAITDHGPGAKNTTSEPYFYVLCNRFPEKIGTIRIFKGIEANILDLKGRTDIPVDPVIRAHFDLILAFMHPITRYKDLGKRKNTITILNALERNPCIDILVHPITNWYDFDVKEVARAAASYGVAIELNEIVLQARKIDLKKMDLLIETTLKFNGNFAISSDAHMATEMGMEEKARELIKKFQIGNEYIINSSMEKILNFIHSRKIHKS